MVISTQEQAHGRVIGMELVTKDSEASNHVSYGWHYALALTVLPIYLRSFAVNKKWQPLTEVFRESDLVPI